MSLNKNTMTIVPKGLQAITFAETLYGVQRSSVIKGGLRLLEGHNNYLTLIF